MVHSLVSFISMVYPCFWGIGVIDTFPTFASLCAGLCGGVTWEEPSVALRPPRKKNSLHYCILYETIFFLLENAFSYICKCIKESVAWRRHFSFLFVLFLFLRHT